MYRRRHRLAVLVAVAALFVSGTVGCGITGSPPASATHGKTKRHQASGADAGGAASPAHWPKLVAQSLALVRGHTQVALQGPTVLPRGNSARVSFSAARYTVNFFECPSVEPLNSPHIGQGMCGAMAAYADGFGGRMYATPAAAREALAYQPPSGTPVAMSLPGGLTASRWPISGRSGLGSTAAVVWHEGEWTIVVTGGPGERAAAVLVARLLQRYRLPAHPGLLNIDAAGDGLHTSAQWVVGSTVYTTSAMHNPAHALVMAASTRPFPRRS